MRACIQTYSLAFQASHLFALFPVDEPILHTIVLVNALLYHKSGTHGDVHSLN